jgi:hypothetical protein
MSKQDYDFWIGRLVTYVEQQGIELDSVLLSVLKDWYGYVPKGSE